MDRLPDEPARGPDRTLPYGPAADQVIDRYDGSGPGLVVLVHGGFWKPAYDREHLRPMAAALSDNGFKVSLVEYRRPESGRWPVISADIRAALAHLGGVPAVIVGHSAGGQLAVWSLHQPEGAGLVGAVSLAGCLDLRSADHDGLGAGAVRALFDGAPPSNADPIRLQPRQPVVAVHGDADLDVPIEISRRYAQRTGARLVEIPDADHWPLITPGTHAFDVTVDSIRTLFARS